MDALNRLAKWRTFFAGWQLGTRPKGDPEGDAVRDHREATLVLRAEASALAGLLVDKGIITREEFTKALLSEAEQLEKDFQERYPGISAHDHGITMKLPEAAETMRRMNFKP